MSQRIPHKTITSPSNETFKWIKKLVSDHHFRRKENVFTVEGLKENQMAWNAHYVPSILIGIQEQRDSTYPSSGEYYNIDASLMDQLIVRKGTSEVLGIYPTPEFHLEHIRLSDNPLICVLQSVEKPGNLGAILRTCDAANVDAVFVCDPRADFFNPNVIRSSVGTVFVHQLYAGVDSDIYQYLRDQNIMILAATPDTDMIYSAMNLKHPTALVFGTEHEGLPTFWLEGADQKVKIPMSGVNDSLNVSVSAGIIIFEAIRQRNEYLNNTNL